MPGLIPLTLIIVPIIEITLFVQIGGAIGLSWTLLIILATAILGARAIRRQGIEALVRAQNAYKSGCHHAANLHIAFAAQKLIAGSMPEAA